MTPEEWQRSTDPTLMLSILYESGPVSERKALPNHVKGCYLVDALSGKDAAQRSASGGE